MGCVIGCVKCVISGAVDVSIVCGEIGVICCVCGCSSILFS